MRGTNIQTSFKYTREETGRKSAIKSAIWNYIHARGTLGARTPSFNGLIDFFM